MQIDALPELDSNGLKALWHDLNGTEAPAIRKTLLMRALAYRIQEKAFGGLSRDARQKIKKMARNLKNGAPVLPTPATAVRPGTRFVRDWGGKTHEVAVLERGFVYRGERYTSLSKIARLITGARWSGPLFFGLKGHPTTTAPSELRARV